MWLAMRGALTGSVRELQSTYHVPISNTAAGVLLLENTTRPELASVNAELRWGACCASGRNEALADRAR